MNFYKVAAYNMNDQFICSESKERFTIKSVEEATTNEFPHMTDIIIYSYWLVGDMGTELELNHNELLEYVQHNKLEEV